MDTHGKVANKFEEIFMEPTEKLIATLGNNYIQNFFINGNISNGFAIVTNKRVYFKGNCYMREGKKFFKTNEERVVDLRDITGTGYIRTKQTWMLVLATILGICSLFLLAMIWEGLDRSTIEQAYGFLTGYLFCAVIGCITFAIVYKITCRNLFQIEFAGGKICFQTVWYDKKEIDDFQRQIRLTKDTMSSLKEQNIVAKDRSVSTNISNISEEIRKSSELLKEGLITEEEYKKIKANLLNL